MHKRRAQGCGLVQVEEPDFQAAALFGEQQAEKLLTHFAINGLLQCTTQSFGEKTISRSHSMVVRRRFRGSPREENLRSSLWALSGCRFLCHCKAGHQGHGDEIVKGYRDMNPGAYDSDDESTGPPTAGVLDNLAKLREDPPEDSESSSDEGAPWLWLERIRRIPHCWLWVCSQGVL